MSWYIIALIIVVIISAVLIQSTKKLGTTEEGLPYTKLGTLFSPAERSFLGVLNQVISNDVYIFGKVRVADVLTPKKGIARSDWQKAFNKISGKHFDYLLCDKDKISILCAIELNDSSHNTKKRNDRDRFLEGACESAGLPLIQITAKKAYNIQNVQQAIAPYLPDSMLKGTAKELPDTPVDKPVRDTEKKCPKCSSPMVKKIAQKGESIGNEFWACSAFPKCRHIETLNE